MRKEIRIAGFGGQGVALMGMILGKALSLHDGVEVVMTQAYGPEARGGASSANLVVSDREIAYPFVQRPDILVALSQEAYNRFSPGVKPDATMILELDLVTPAGEGTYFAIPATSLAEGLGRRIVTNVVMLGFVVAITGLTSRRSIEETIRTTVKEKTIPLNLRALAVGYDYATENTQLQYADELSEVHSPEDGK